MSFKRSLISVKTIYSLIGFSSYGRCFLVANIFLYLIIGRQINYIMIKIINIKDIDIMVLLILMNGFKMFILSKESSELFEHRDIH